MAEQKAQKSCCCKVISLGLAILSLFLLFYWPTPICSVESFDVFALHKTPSSPGPFTNRSLHYDLKLKNRSYRRIYYDALNLAFYYKPNLSQHPIGNASYPSFRQGIRRTAHRVGSFEATPGVISENVTSVFRVELATEVRYGVIFWNTKRRHLVVAADLEVNEQGSLVKGKKNKGIKLMRSGAPKIKGWFYLVTFLIFIYFL